MADHHLHPDPIEEGNLANPPNMPVNPPNVAVNPPNTQARPSQKKRELTLKHGVTMRVSFIVCICIHLAKPRLGSALARLN